ncbi:GntR family transcriptional regulator [Leucobacter sp. GX24907]
MTNAHVFDSLTLERGSSTPPKHQLHRWVIEGVAAGRLKPGQKLPTIRALAERLGLAVNTVAGAYRSLEEAGVVEGRGRSGTFIAFDDDPLEAQAQEIAAEAARRLRALGITQDRAMQILRDAVEVAAEVDTSG